MAKETKKLMMCINGLKSDLFQIAENTGLDSRYTLECSIQLDELIKRYHQENEKNNTIE
ncbi:MULTISPECIES: aspartyl-phosphate phosphatase Spo0E family protein [Bacillaceae]|uniref:Spo0E family sporulation regulatory protein-aspartic acid phosphatase n=1 Tax=Metabacillus endolithicus TaxID=1535204 RepID=A0ABW5C138_9BACI|nr:MULTISPECIES: aspartyl-phosphate phosphatase Spo0E family protein [Bacillaceae]PGT77111.1 hypothetical protein COD11_25335 [Bacillus sp. AFS040349]UPG63954.1 aspartyl-phosphate phosphatase Spo0E family protein [Metabacillus endolithicus]